MGPEDIILGLTNASLNFREAMRGRSMSEYEVEHEEALHRRLAAEHKLERLRIEAAIREMEAASG